MNLKFTFKSITSKILPNTEKWMKMRTEKNQKTMKKKYKHSVDRFTISINVKYVQNPKKF